MKRRPELEGEYAERRMRRQADGVGPLKYTDPHDGVGHSPLTAVSAIT